MKHSSLALACLLVLASSLSGHAQTPENPSPASPPPPPPAFRPPPPPPPTPSPSGGGGTVVPVSLTWVVPYAGSHDISLQCGQSVQFQWPNSAIHDVIEQYSGEPTSPTSLCSPSTQGKEWQAPTAGPETVVIPYDASLPNIRNFFCSVGVHCRSGGMYITLRWPSSCSAGSPPPSPIVSSPSPSPSPSPRPPRPSPSPSPSPPPPSPPPPSPPPPSPPPPAQSPSPVVRPPPPPPPALEPAFISPPPSPVESSPPVVTRSPSPPPRPRPANVTIPWNQRGTPHVVDVKCGDRITFTWEYSTHDIRQVKPGSARYLCSQKRRPMRRLTVFRAGPFSHTIRATIAGTFAFIDGFRDHCEVGDVYTTVRVKC